MEESDEDVGVVDATALEMVSSGTVLFGGGKVCVYIVSFYIRGRTDQPYRNAPRGYGVP